MATYAMRRGTPHILSQVTDSTSAALLPRHCEGGTASWELPLVPVPSGYSGYFTPLGTLEPHGQWPRTRDPMATAVAGRENPDGSSPRSR